MLRKKLDMSGYCARKQILDRRQTGSYSEMGCEKFSNSAKSGCNKGTIRRDIRYRVVSREVRRHRLISISYISHGRCRGRGREFESRRPRHSFQKSSPNFTEPIVPLLDSVRPRARELALCKCIYLAVYIYPGGRSWPPLAYLSPGTAKL
jgi:hypothetical protein